MKFEFYKHVEQEAELEELKEILTANNLYYEISTPKILIDSSIVGHTLVPKYTIKLLPADFEEANEVIHKAYKASLKIEDFPHLAELSNTELRAILTNSSDWSMESEIIARKLLESRNIELSEDEIISLKEMNNESVRQGKKVPVGLQFAYFIAIQFGFYFGIIFFIAGIVMGAYYSFGKTTDKHGIKHFVYDKRARLGGHFILYGGIIALVIQLILIVYADFAH